MSLAIWDARSSAERRNLVSAAVVIAIVLVLALVWLPLERARERLSAQMPGVRASIVALRRDADEVKRLRSMPANAPRAVTPLATLATNGGGLAGATITALDERRVKVSGGDVGFGALLEWLRNAQQTHGMRVESARLDALPTTGRVRAELILTRS